MARWLAAISESTASASLSRARDSSLLIELAGDWRLSGTVPSADAARGEIASDPKPPKVILDGRMIGSWDSALLIFIESISEASRMRQVPVDLALLPAGVARLISLAEAVPERKGARAETRGVPLLERIGMGALSAWGSAQGFVTLIGALAIAFGKLIRGVARYRRVDLLQLIQECGANALGIVTLISFLVGVILAFMGAVQLQQFGASIYVADLVGIGIVREMGAMMTGIIMAGRTGAAFAAQLGTMKVTEEIDALTTMGISPVEFLVMPRFIALVLMMPLLCLYSDLMGIAGGAAVGATMLGIPLKLYYQETIAAVTLTQLFGGLFKATTYGALIALAGCVSGMQCGGSASAVGDATTRAVVSGIVLIVAACGLFAVIFNVLGI